MKLSKPLMVSASILASLLIGCGGGGGGASPEASPTQVSLSGNAAKGALIGAEVKAYEIINGVKSNSVWASATTDSSGAYTLSGKPTTNPVVVEVVANANTTMLDEAQIEEGGSFKKVPAPVRLSLRSFVPSMTETANVQVNPITEAAVAMANASLVSDKLTLDVLNAAKQVALQMAPADTNPFSQKPPLKATEMSSEQIKLSAMMAGLTSSANTSCGLSCQVGKLSEGIKVDVGADGKGTLTSEAASKIQTRRTDLLTQGQKAWLDNSSNASSMGNIYNEVKTAATSALSASKKNAVPTSTKPASEFAAAEGLEGFISALRNGFKATEKNLLKAEDDLNSKYQKLTFAGSQDTQDAIKSVQRDCFENQTNYKTSFSCSPTPDSNVKWTQNGDTWKGQATTYDGRSWQGTVSGSITDGTLNATLNAETKSASGALLTKIENLKLLVKPDSPSNAGDFFADGLIWAYADNGLVVSLAAKNWTGKLSKKSATQKGTITGEVTLSANNGDKLQGTIVASGNTTQTTHTYFSYNCGLNTGCTAIWTEDELTLGDFELHLTAMNSNSQLLALDVIGSQTMRDKNKPESATNFTKFSSDISVVMTQSLTLKMSSGISDWSTEKYAVTIASGGSEVNVSGVFTIAEAAPGNTSNKWCVNTLRCASHLDLTSGNKVYSAKLTRLNGQPQGDIYKGSTQVGVIKDGIMQINGREVSIY
jgi:hypothetical protein